MRPLGLALLLTLVSLFAPAASAGLGAGTQLEAAAPVAIDGRVDSLLPAGIAVLSADGTGFFTYQLTAGELNVTYHQVDRCEPPPAAPTTPVLPGGCDPTASPAQRDAPEQVTLTDARVTISRATPDTLLLVTTDPSYRDTPSFGDGGRLVATAAMGTAIDAIGERHSYDASNAAWGPNADHATPTVYSVDAGGVVVSATAAQLAATGGFESYLVGVKTTIAGTTADGEPFSRSYDTPISKGTDEPYRYLELEASDAVLVARTSGPFLGLADGGARPVFDIHTRARFDEATGKVVDEEGAEDEMTTPETVTLEGPISATLTKVVADRSRLAFSIVDGLRIEGTPIEDEDRPLDAQQLAAAGAAGAGGAGLLIAAAYFWPRLKFAATLLALPLYSRIERQDVLEHGKRDEIYELIRASPGIHAHDIGEKAQIGWGTTVYHLKLLENHDLVVSKRSGRYKRFFVNTGEYTKKKDLYGALRNDTAKAVANYVAQHPGTSQKDLCAALGIQPSLASWHVEKLEGVGLVKRMKDGRQVRYFAGPAWSELQPSAGASAGARNESAET